MIYNPLRSKVYVNTYLTNSILRDSLPRAYGSGFSRVHLPCASALWWLLARGERAEFAQGLPQVNPDGIQ